MSNGLEAVSNDPYDSNSVAYIVSDMGTTRPNYADYVSLNFNFLSHLFILVALTR